MSASTENTTPSLCEQVLDYAYDELAGDAKVVFEQHLQTCAKCQAELASFKRVRGAVKAVLPSVEPPANATGALHAQLLHAAAQRGGKVIPFGRRVQRVMMHPAMLAAAMFVLIGGAAGTLWYRGHILMPAPTAEAPPAPPAPSVATATPSEQPAFAGDETTVKTELPKEETGRQKVAEKKKDVGGYYKGALATEGGEAENKVFLGLPGKDSSPMPVHRAPAMHAAGKLAGADRPAAAADKPADLSRASGPAKKAPVSAVTAPAEPMPVMKTRKMDNAAFDDSFGGVAADSKRGSGGAVGGVMGGMPASTGATTSDTRTRRDQPAKPAPKAKREESAPQGGSWNGTVNAAPPPKASSAPSTLPEGNQKAQVQVNERAAPASPAPVQQQIDGRAAGTKSSNVDNSWRNTTTAKEQKPMASPQAAEPPPQQGAYARSNESVRKQALDFADAGRCPDAVRLFDQLQKERYSLGNKELVAYKRCKSKLEEASKQDKNFQNRMIQDAEKVNDENLKAPQRVASPKPSAESPAQSEQQASKQSKKGKKRATESDAPPAASDPASKAPGL